MTTLKEEGEDSKSRLEFDQKRLHTLLNDLSLDLLIQASSGLGFVMAGRDPTKKPVQQRPEFGYAGRSTRRRRRRAAAPSDGEYRSRRRRRRRRVQTEGSGSLRRCRRHLTLQPRTDRKSRTQVA